MSLTDTPLVAGQFESAGQQRHAATVGMWVFLATEVLFFGGLFLGYAAYRFRYPAGFRAASAHTLVAAGATNTAILLISSLTMVLAVRAAESRRRWQLLGFLALTGLLAMGFLGLKAFEYSTEIHEGLLPGDHFRFVGGPLGPARIFFSFYFVMTGLHAIHVTIGIGLMGWLSLRALSAPRLEALATSVDLLGLYWHFVDIVWVFLFPLLYLLGRHP